MGYYPQNFYSNYPYQNGYNQVALPQNVSAQQQTQQVLPQQNILNSLNGKIVDSIDVARVADVPFGGYGIFPKADLSEIYIKTWNNNGTTSVVTFKPIVNAKTVNEHEEGAVEEHKMLMDRMDSLEEKLEEFLKSNKENKTKIIQRKELSADAY